MAWLSVLNNLRTGMVSSGAQTLQFAELSNMVKHDIEDNLNMVKHGETVTLPTGRYDTSTLSTFILVAFR